MCITCKSQYKEVDGILKKKKTQQKTQYYHEYLNNIDTAWKSDNGTKQRKLSIALLVILMKQTPHDIFEMKPSCVKTYS
jgi:hypothetical protein